MTVAVAALFVVTTLKPEWLPRSAAGRASFLPAPTLTQGLPATEPGASAASSGYALAARRAAPAVVSVTATRTARENPHADDPRFRFFFGDRYRVFRLCRHKYWGKKE